jgi:predicted DNA-binding WGR domain protein
MEPITLTRIDEAANMHRFYRLSIQPGLFGDVALIREWGRIGSHGQSKTDWFESEPDAKDARFSLHMKKAKRGYE